jgi:hypothetical protein
MWSMQPRNLLVEHTTQILGMKVFRPQYPRLSRMAIDLPTIPAMSNHPEWTFSSCSHSNPIGNPTTAGASNGVWVVVPAPSIGLLVICIVVIVDSGKI